MVQIKLDSDSLPEEGQRVTICIIGTYDMVNAIYNADEQMFFFNRSKISAFDVKYWDANDENNKNSDQ